MGIIENKKAFIFQKVFYGGLSMSLIEPFVHTIEVSEIIKFSHPKPWDNTILLTDLYVKKGYSLRRISRELGCHKSVVRRKLSEAVIEIIQRKVDVDKVLVKKVQGLRAQGLSYQKIAGLFNLWRIRTKTGGGIRYGQNIKGIMLKD